jgi:hypothetical protein
MKVIVAEKKYDCSHLLGKFVDESHYDYLIEEDCDVYMPATCDLSTVAECDKDCSACDAGADERKVILKFRKNFFSKEEQEQAYQGLREAAVQSQNRGLAAGPREGKLNNREWLTDYQDAMLDYFINHSASLEGDRLDEIDKIDRSTITGRQVWLSAAVEKNKFNFDEWVTKVKLLPPEVAKEEAENILTDFISITSYANLVYSGIAGWFDRYPRIPYGRATSYTRDKFDKFKLSYPFLQSLSRGFKNLMPWRYNNQLEVSKKLDPSFLVPGTPFTTVTVNNTFRTAAHYDAGDLTTGLSNLLVLSNNGNYSGGYLIAPEYRVAVNVRPGDLLLINNHEVMHGNTPIVLLDEEAERISLVVYFREKMLELGSKEYEQTRYEFVEERRLNKEHKGHVGRALWNGVGAGMWESEEWYEYCSKAIGVDEMHKYHPEAIKANSLEDFF